MHMRRMLGRAKGRFGKDVRERYAMVLEEFTEMIGELPSELRRLAVHLMDRWRQVRVLSISWR